jgi:hypothetical protein
MYERDAFIISYFNSSGKSFDQLLDSFGTSLLIDYIYLIGLVPMSLIGSILCSINVLVFFQKEFKPRIYFYYRILSIIQVVHLITSIFYGISYSPRVITLFNIEVSAFYTVYYIPIANCCFYYSGLIEIAILLDRLIIFNAKIRSLYTISPQKMSFILFLVCFTVNFFYFFAFRAKEETINYYDNRGNFVQQVVYLIRYSQIALTKYGKITMIIMYFVRDILTLVTSIFFNILSAYFLKKYLKNKARTSEASNLKLMESLSKSNSTLIIINTNNNNNFKTKSKEKAADRRTSVMVSILCAIGILTRTMLTVAEINFIFSTSYTAQLIYCIADFLIVMSSAISFIIFWCFDKNFKTGVKKLFLGERPEKVNFNNDMAKVLEKKQEIIKNEKENIQNNLFQ